MGVGEGRRSRPRGGHRLLIPFAALALLASAAGCTSASSDALPPSTPAPTRTTVPKPPLRVTIEPLTATAPAGSYARPDPAGPLDGELSDATVEAGRCPDPYPAAARTATVTAGGVAPPTPAPAHPVRLSRPDEVPTPASIEPLPIRRDAELEQAINERLGEDAPRYAVIVKDLSDGRGVAINDERLFYAASLFKLEVMYEIFHQHAAGLLDFEERFIASDYYAGFDLGPHLISQCDEVTIARALEAMMSVSDNVAAVLLQDRAGPRNINLAMEALGLTATGLLEDALPTNARDIALLVETIASGQGVDQPSAKEMLDLMASEKVNDRIPSGLPDGTLVAHKTGNWENATHDAGIIYGEKSAYLVVLMSDIGFDGDAGSVERDITRIIWQHFEGTE